MISQSNAAGAITRSGLRPLAPGPQSNSTDIRRVGTTLRRAISPPRSAPLAGEGQCADREQTSRIVERARTQVGNPRPFAEDPAGRDDERGQGMDGPKGRLIDEQAR